MSMLRRGSPRSSGVSGPPGAANPSNLSQPTPARTNSRGRKAMWRQLPSRLQGPASVLMPLVGLIAGVASRSRMDGATELKLQL